MSILSHKPPWYAAGLAFECVQCGRCCAGPEEGYVWATKEELHTIADHLALPIQEMMRQHVRAVGGRYSLREQAGSNDCVFLAQRTDLPHCRGCVVYQLRPAQCRTWPFWRTNLSSPRAWSQAGQRCPGINRGRRYTFDEIQSRLTVTQ